MAVGDLVTEPFRYEYSGFAVGPDTGFYVKSCSGLIGYPALRSGTVNRFGGHGGRGGRHYMPVREFILIFDHPHNDDAEFAAARKAVMRAFHPRVHASQEEPFVFWHPGGEKLQINARPIDFSSPLERRFALKFPEVAVRMEAVDPLHYSLQEFQQVVSLTADTTGLVFPLDFPLNFGPSSSSQASLFNGGSADAPWRVEITGPIEGPRLEKVGTGEILNLPNLNIEAGHTLIIDEKDRTILLDGVASRRGDLTAASRWFKLDAESTTTIQFASNGVPSGSTATFTWRYADWGES
jgi:hypothetical protein